MIVFPNAKINIGLYITEKREDGFHNLESVFYPIPWKDALEAILSSHFSFESSGLEIPGKSDQNLIIKAFQLIKPFLNAQNSVKIHLHKAIPMGAGLGGGSADGAFALKLLNEIFALNLPTKKLEELAAQLGSDCPFFIQNKPVFCYDRGIKFKPIDLDLSQKFIALVNPKIHISTAEAFSNIKPEKPKNNLLEMIQKPISEWKGLIHNNFEISLATKYPIIEDIKNQLYECGAVYASMTGSGSTVYGIFEQNPLLQNQFKGMTVWSKEL